MKREKLKSIMLLEVVVLILIGLFSFDFLPRNYNEFQRICSVTWPKDPKQYQICMEPYFRQTNLDKYAIGVGVLTLVLLPVVYSSKNSLFKVLH